MRHETPSLVVVFALASAIAACGGGGDDLGLKAGASAAGSGGATTTSTSAQTSTTTAVTSAGSGGDVGAGGGSGGGGGSLATSSSSAGAGGGPIGDIDSGIISTSAASLLESETSVSAGTNGFVAVVYIGEKANGGSTNGYAFSKDDGKTWLPASSLDSPGGRVASDPVVATDSKNNFYMSWVGFKRNAMGDPLDMHVYVAVAPAGTTTFGATVEITDGNPNGQYDKPWVVVTHQDAVLVTYAKTSTGGIYAARSSDGAQTFKVTAIVEDMNFRNLVFPCVPATGNRIWVTYNAGGGVGLRWSDDDGATFPDANKSAVADPNEPVPAFEDSTCVADGNEVWVSYGLSMDMMMPGETSTAELDTIKVAHSADGGQTIDWRVDAGDVAAAPLFLLPTIAREPGGALDLVYYAGKAEGDAMGSYRRSRSTDAGKTWDPSIALKQGILFTGDRTSPKWLGDYTGVVIHDGHLDTSYADNTNGMYSHIAFYAASLPAN